MTRLIAGLLLALLVQPAGAARLDFSGEAVAGGLLIGTTESDAQVFIDGNRVRVSPQGSFLVGFHREEPEPVIVKVVYSDGREARRRFEVRQREYRVQRIDGLPPRQVSPTEEDLKRIRREYALARRARARDDARTDFLVDFVWPTIGPISGVYGSQRVLNGKPRRPHYGVDVAVPTGTPVHAPAPGLVTLAHPDMYFSGGTLILDHGHGLSSSFLHLSKLLVSVGQRVKQGDIIAEVGATGRVTGAHLDWRMNLKKKRLDPALLVGPMP
ncbi:MAG: M23 family metallopeptidase, partial [Gammaproteobacteria bacterium]|nr:M23 family metallopeptidase [Gammaproteobacteria bacterium]